MPKLATKLYKSPKNDRFYSSYRLWWLDHYGGRDEKDVLKDAIGEFIYMGDGDGDIKKIYLTKQCQKK